MSRRESVCSIYYNRKGDFYIEVAGTLPCGKIISACLTSELDACATKLAHSH